MSFWKLRKISSFWRNRRGNVAVIFGLTAMPAVMLVGGALDFARAARYADHLQAAVDAATLYGAIVTLDDRDARAKEVLSANLAAAGGVGPLQSSFSVSEVSPMGLPSVYTGSGTITLPTSFMKIMNINEITLTRVARAEFGSGDGSCILTLGADMELEDDAMVFNGAPKVDLSGCTLRSNKSMKCNGGGIGAYASIAVGDVTKCPNPIPHSRPIPDIYKVLQDEIELKCGASVLGATWSAGDAPSGPAMIVTQRAGYKQVNVCGPLTLSGSGDLTPANSTEDWLIIVENGSLILSTDADVAFHRTTLVLSGETGDHHVEFPSGTGKLASLAVSSAIGETNPWRGIAIYQDPRLTTGVDLDWGPGATFTFDGVAYFPNAAFLLSGVAQTGPSACSKIVSYSFRINGAVGLKQNVEGCANQKVAEYRTYPRLLR